MPACAHAIPFFLSEHAQGPVLGVCGPFGRATNPVPTHPPTQIRTFSFLPPPPAPHKCMGICLASCAPCFCALPPLLSVTGGLALLSVSLGPGPATPPVFRPRGLTKSAFFASCANPLRSAFLRPWMRCEIALLHLPFGRGRYDHWSQNMNRQNNTNKASPTTPANYAFG